MFLLKFLEGLDRCVVLLRFGMSDTLKISQVVRCGHIRFAKFSFDQLDGVPIRSRLHRVMDGPVDFRKPRDRLCRCRIRLGRILSLETGSRRDRPGDRQDRQPVKCSLD